MRGGAPVAAPAILEKLDLCQTKGFRFRFRFRFGFRLRLRSSFGWRFGSRVSRSGECNHGCNQPAQRGAGCYFGCQELSPLIIGDGRCRRVLVDGAHCRQTQNVYTVPSLPTQTDVYASDAVDRRARRLASRLQALLARPRRADHSRSVSHGLYFVCCPRQSSSV